MINVQEDIFEININEMEDQSVFNRRSFHEKDEQDYKTLISNFQQQRLEKAKSTLDVRAVNNFKQQQKLSQLDKSMPMLNEEEELRTSVG